MDINQVPFILVHLELELVSESYQPSFLHVIKGHEHR